MAEQVESSYGQLGALLADLDVSPGDLVTERIFCRDLGRDHGDIAAIRSAFYSSCGLEGEELPAASWTQQGPCRPSAPPYPPAGRCFATAATRTFI